MDTQFLSAIDEVASKVSLQIVDEQISPPLWGSDGYRCLLIDGLRLCASVVPLKNEIEVWLDDHSGPNGPESFDAGELRAALDQPPEAIMFSEQTYSACLEMMSRLMEDIASNLSRDRDGFLTKLRTQRAASSRRDHEKTLRSQGETAWRSGNREEAAELYRQLAEPTPVELKRIKVADRNQSSSSS